MPEAYSVQPSSLISARPTEELLSFGEIPRHHASSYTATTSKCGLLSVLELNAQAAKGHSQCPVTANDSVPCDRWSRANDCRLTAPQPTSSIFHWPTHTMSCPYARNRIAQLIRIRSLIIFPVLGATTHVHCPSVPSGLRFFGVILCRNSATCGVERPQN